MAKICCACGKSLGFFSNKATLKNGYLCQECQRAGGISLLDNSENLVASKVAAVVYSRKETVRKFRATKKYDDIQIDTDSHSFMLKGNFYLFENLHSFSYHENPNNPQNNGNFLKSGGAVVGGLIGGIGGGVIKGVIGAAVGSKVGSYFSNVCNYMYISITLKDSLVSDVRLQYITEKTRVASDEYSDALKRAQSCIEGLTIIADYNEAQRKAASTNNKEQKSRKSKDVFIQNKHFTASELADELTILKNLLYSGDLTEEEYNQKKQQLLNLK